MVEYLPLDTDQIDFEILSENTVLFTRSAESSSSPPSIEKCLTSSTNNQYTIKLLPISGNSWPEGSYLTIFGKNNNAVFKTTLSASNEESYVLSLYYGIDQGAAWQMTSGVLTSIDWTAYSFLTVLGRMLLLAPIPFLLLLVFNISENNLRVFLVWLLMMCDCTTRLA